MQITLDLPDEIAQQLELETKQSAVDELYERWAELEKKLG